MRPYSLEKDHLGREVRVPWPADKANVVLKRIDAEVEAEMRAVTAERAKEVGCKVVDGILQVCEWVPSDDGGGAYVVNPVASAIQHSGAEKTDETNLRWWAFCSEPQDPAQVSDEIRKPVRKVPARLPQTLCVTKVSDLPPSRPRGRPRKESMANV